MRFPSINYIRASMIFAQMGLAVILTVALWGGALLGESYGAPGSSAIDGRGFDAAFDNSYSGAWEDSNSPVNEGEMTNESGSAHAPAFDCPTITVLPLTLPACPRDLPCNLSFTASGGTSPYNFIVLTGPLPTGLNLSSSGVLSGTPTKSGSYNIAIAASDAFNCFGAQSYTFVVPCPTITFTPTTLAEATLDATYSQTITAVGGIGTYQYQTTAGVLPPGISLSTAGVLSGTPTRSGTYAFEVTVTDSDQCTASQNYTLTVNCSTITLLPATLPAAFVGVTYRQTLTTNGGTGPYTYTFASIQLPQGMSLAATGNLVWTPMRAGSYTVTIISTDARSCMGVRDYTITVSCPALSLSPTRLPAGTLGAAYNQVLTASGGVGPYQFAVASGTLPAGLGFSNSGVLSGTPTGADTYNFSITAIDANGCSGSQSYTLNIVIACPAITVAPQQLPNGTMAVAYNQRVTASGGVSPYQFTVSSGTFPGGLTLTSTGVLSGAPANAGTSTFIITAMDANGCIGIQTYTLSIVYQCTTISLGPETLPAAFLGIAYAANLSASGGISPYTFALTSGSLPGGLALPSSGAITGTPAAAGNFNITVTAVDAHQCSGSKSYAITVTIPNRKGEITSPVNGSALTLSVVTFAWNSGSGVDEFALFVGTTAGGREVFGEGTGAAQSKTITGLPVDASTIYVRLWSKIGAIWQYSDYTYTACSGCEPSTPAKATLLSPTGGATLNKPPYTWKAVPTATWYRLWVNDSTTSAGKIVTWYTAAQAGCASGTGACSVIPDVAIAQGEAQWWIQAWNATGGYGPWSSNVVFNVNSGSSPERTTLVVPSNTISQNTPTFEWYTIMTATHYQLLVKDATGAIRIMQWYTSSQAQCSIESLSCTLAPGVALGSGTYQWWVQTANKSGDGPWSNPVKFTIAAGSAPEVGDIPESPR